MKKLLLIIAVLSLPILVQAEPMEGYDYLGMQHPRWNCDASIEVLPQGVALGTLHQSFGDSLECIEKAYRSGKIKIHRVHLENGPGMTNGVLQKHEGLFGFSNKSFDLAVKSGKISITQQIVEKCKLYVTLGAKYGVEVWCSPVLEHMLSPEAFDEIARQIRQAIPGVVLVNNARNGTPARGNYLMERHGTRLLGDIVSLDGETAEDIDYREYLKQNARSKIIFQWSRKYNGRLLEGFVPITDRKAFPTVDDFRELVSMFNPLARAPRPAISEVTKYVKLQKPFLWKLSAEDKGNGDVRANKPMFISKSRSGKLYVVGCKGEQIGALGYYGPFEGGLYRHYSGFRGGSGDRGFELAQKAKRVTGHEWVWIKDGKTAYGPLAPRFRWGYYR